MTTDLFFAPALPQTAPSSFQCDRRDSFSSDPNLKTEAPGLSKDDSHENFLTTLKKVSRDQNSTEGSPSTGSPAKAWTAITNRQPDNDEAVVQQSDVDEILTDIMSVLNHDASGMEDQTPMAAELKELITLLEALRWAGSSEDQQVRPGEGLTLENMSRSAAKYQNLLATFNQNLSATFKQMIGELQSNDLKVGNDMSTGLEQLRLLFARVLTADVSKPNADVPRDGLNQNQSPLPVELASWAKGIIQDQENGVGNHAARAVEGGGTAKPVDVSAVTSRIAADPDMVTKGLESAKTGEPFGNVPLSENTDKTDGSRLNPEVRVAAESDGSAKDPKVLVKLPVKDVENDPAVKPDNTKRNSSGGHTLASAASGREPAPENSLPGDKSGVSKAINDALAGKENPVKADSAPGGDAVSQAAKPEAGTNDSGQLASQNQTSERTIETSASTRESDGAQRELRTQTMEQIVRRAVFQIKNGQQEARIDLKPDFLGHVRMQVITENQQVTVKILTEFGFVKDMIENNIQQLKADLQQQGLEVDKLDVSVSRDANGNKHHQQNAEHAGRRSRENNTGDNGNSDEDRPDQKDRSTRKSEGLSTVDYFA